MNVARVVIDQKGLPERATRGGVLDTSRWPMRRGSRLPPLWSKGRAPRAANVGGAGLFRRLDERYDRGMTRSKIAITLPRDQLARVHREVRAGRAESVSGYIARVLAEHEKRESLRALLRDLTEQYGEPGAEDIKWAERALAPRRRG
jgi:hypothetical protein